MNAPKTLMRVGITATRVGLTQHQEATLFLVLQTLYLHRGARFFHHGDCVGGDQEGACNALLIGYTIISHPPVDERLRGFFPSHVVHEAADYHTRDRALVDAVNVVIGCPREEPEQARGGTWYTIRYARQQQRPLIVIGPKGDALELHGFTHLPREVVV